MDTNYIDPWNTATIPHEARDDPNTYARELTRRACAAAERMPFAADDVRQAVTQLVEADETSEPNVVARMVLATTSPAYSRAFIKLIRSRGQTSALLPEESQALQRAMTLTDAQGGFLVPLQLDPSVTITANGSFNEVRKIARQVVATGDVWKGISSAGVSGSWDGESEEVSDDSPTLAQPEIPVHKLRIFIPLSHELQMDAPGLADELATMIAFEKETKESIAFVTGSGSGQPTGIITALTGSGSVVPSAGTDTFAVGDVYNLDQSLPARWAANGSWLAHRAIYNKMRQFDTNGGAQLWGYLADGRKRELLGRPDYVSEAMKNGITNGQDNLVLAFGDFRNFVVVDRLGTTMSYIPHLFGANGRPKGEAGWYAWARTGSGCLNPGAFRMLNVT